MSFADLTLERYSCRKYEKRAVESEKLDARARFAVHYARVA